MAKEDKEDEITIDFSKIAFWKKKAKKEPENKHSSHKEKEESKEKNETEINEEQYISYEQAQNEEIKLAREERMKTGMTTDEDEEEQEKEIIKKTEPKHEHKEKHKTEKKDEEEVSIDVKKIGKWLSKNKQQFLAVVLILIPIFFMLFFRMYAANLPIAGDCNSFSDKIFGHKPNECWGSNSVYSYYQNQITQQVNAQYPNLPDANKQELINAQFKDFVSKNQKTIEEQSKANGEYLKATLQGENGYTYLADIDSYVWLRQAENIVKNGHTGDTIKNGITWDNLVWAPFGASAGSNLYPYVEAYLYYSLHAVNSHITVMRSAFYTPFLFSILAIIAAFFLARKVAGNVGGFFAAMMVAINPFFLTRTFGSDTDSMVVTFPIIILWLFVEALESKKLWTGITIAGIAGLMEGIYAFGWVYWYVFDFILGAIFLFLIYHMIVHRNKIKKGLKYYFKETDAKKVLIITAAFIVFTGIFVTLFTNFNTFVKGPIEPLGFLSLKQTTTENLWPNVYTTVAELNPANIRDTITNIGGKTLFVISLLGMLLIMVRKQIKTPELLFIIGSFIWYVLLMTNSMLNINPKIYLALLVLPIVLGLIYFMNRGSIGDTDAKLAIIIMIWYVATIFASLSGVRFVLLMVPVFAVSFGIAIGIIYQHISSWLANSLKIDKLITKIAVFCLLSLLLLAPLKAADNVSRTELPIMNDAWYNALIKINKESQPNAIINSWWDFGHHFKYVAQRGVTFDGASQNTPIAHWIGKVILTSNEEEAIGLLRMLDCGSNRAFEQLNQKINDTSLTVKILKEIAVQNRDAAKTTLLGRGMTSDEAENILQYTHCAPPEDYFITSDDMVGKSGVWAHFGSWNFTRADIWQNVKTMPKDKATEYMTTAEDFKLTKEAAEKLYYEANSIKNDAEANSWIAPWPSYAGTASCAPTKDANVLQCSNGIIINLTNYDVTATTQQGIQKPASIVYKGEYQLMEKKFDNSTIPLSIALLKEGESYTAVLMQPELAMSTFTKLYYFKGFGTKHFDLFTHEQGITGTNVYVWKVDWQGKTDEQLQEKYMKLTVAKGDKISVDYIGFLEDNTIFDSSIQNWRSDTTVGITANFSNYKTTPLTFTAGAGQMIQGFDEAVIGMKKGQEGIIQVLPEKAYGTDPAAHPLGNKTLFFKIRIESVE